MRRSKTDGVRFKVSFQKVAEAPGCTNRSNSAGLGGSRYIREARLPMNRRHRSNAQWYL